MKNLFMILGTCLLCVAGSAAKAAVVWSGTAVDIRTGQPLAGVVFYGGGKGRVDLTAPSTTGADGRFSVSYPTALDLTFWEYYLLTGTYTPAATYFEHSRISTSPSDTVVRMVPKNAFIRGVVRDKVTGLVIPTAQVSLGIPGAYFATVSVNAQGEFSFETPAYAFPFGNLEEGIPPAEQVPHLPTAQVQPVTNYWLEVTATGYGTMNTMNLGLAINLLSSVSSNLHTWVDLSVVPNSSTAQPAATSRIVDPNAFQVWLAKFFTPTELADSLITGANADPDGDGLTNQQEFDLNTNPKNPDTDGDGLPDGWEVANGLNPLVPDADQDPDGDSFSNRLEFLFGTNPKSAASKPDVTVGIRRAVRVEFPTIVGVRYQLMSADAATGPWTNVGAPFSGTGASYFQYFDADPAREKILQIEHRRRVTARRSRSFG